MIKLVDGFNIRNTLDIEFSGLSSLDKNCIIPAGEVWLDKIYKQEAKLFIETDKSIDELMKDGFSYEEAKKELRKSFNKEVNYVGRYYDKEIQAFIVDGAQIRTNIDPKFQYGGHWLIYDYIPKNTIWLDDKVIKEELKYIFRHEFVEVQYMLKGKSYNCSHDHANAEEKELRRQTGVGHYAKD